MANKLKVWDTDKYYQCAQKGSSDMQHPAMKHLLKLSRNAKTILDLGCGEGTRLNNLSNSVAKLYGIDISKKAITLASTKFKHIKFVVGDLENLPFKENSFDLTYSAYVLEHLKNPETVVDEAIRVTKNNGKILFVCPNYGAPNRCSPVYEGSRLKKLLNGYINDLKVAFLSKNKLDWNTVTPIANKDNYEMDLDTTIEPYQLTLVSYLENKGLTVKTINSWSEELSSANLLQKIIKLLSDLRIFPFTMWQPHLIVVAIKN